MKGRRRKRLCQKRPCQVEEEEVGFSDLVEAEVVAHVGPVPRHANRNRNPEISSGRQTRVYGQAVPAPTHKVQFASLHFGVIAKDQPFDIQLVA